MVLIHDHEIDPFTEAYLTAALWTEETQLKEMGAADPTIYSLADEPEGINRAMVDCYKFQRENEDLLESLDAGQAGHDFWLTRNGHGVGFWDRDYSDHSPAIKRGDGFNDLGKALTAAAKKFGETDLYLGDDGKLYFSR